MTSMNKHRSPESTSPRPIVGEQILPEARKLYDIDMLEQWRAGEMQRLQSLRDQDNDWLGNLNPVYLQQYYGGVDGSLTEFLQRHGLSEGDDEYEGVRALYDSYGLHKIPDSHWYTSPAVRGEDPDNITTAREAAMGEIRQWHVSNSGREDDYGRSLDNLVEELKTARDTWAAMQAKRQGRMGDRHIKGYNDAKEAYHRLQQELGAKQLEATLGDGTVSGEIKNRAVLDFIINEQKELRQLINEKVKNTPVARFVDRLSGWLSGGGVASRLAKGATIGLAAGVVGGALGLAAGAAGAGAAIAGLTAGAVKMAARFGVGYARHDAKQGRGLPEEMVDDDIYGLRGAIDGADDGKLLENALQRAAIITEDGTKQEQRKRRRSALTALGGMAVGNALAVGAGFVLDHLTVASYNATDGVSQPLGYDPDPAPRSADVPPDLSGRTMPGDLMDTPDSVVEQSSLPDYTTEARSIDWGEGWYQTFGEIGIPEDLHAELLQDTELMTQLQGMGLAYPDTTIGGWGIIMTEDGMMPPEALELIRRAALAKGVVLVA